MIGLAAFVDRARPKTPKRSPPPGREWRVGAGGTGREPRVTIYSKDYKNACQEKPGERLAARADFDELVIVGLLHLERMGTRFWFLSIGDDKILFEARSDGTIVKGEWYR